MAAESRPRKLPPSDEAARRSESAPPPPVASAAPPAPTERPPASARPPLPFLLDFFPLEGPEHTRLSAFYDELRRRRFTTTRCSGCGQLHWPPRVACPACHSESLGWVELPTTGRIYAFSAVLAGAPLGLEGDVPFAVGLVDLDGVPLRIFGRIDGRPWPELHVGDPVRVVPYDLPDGRAFYRFEVVP